MTTGGTRTDIHRPTALITEDYEYVGAYDNDTGTFTGERSRFRTLLSESGTARYGTGHQCDHCGAHIRYVAVLRHGPTEDHIAVGEVCLDNRFSLATADFQRLRKAAQLDREAARRREQAEEFRADYPEVPWELLDVSPNSFVQDVLRKLAQWGTISPRQLEAIIRVVRQDIERASQPVEVKVPAPIGKVTFTGEVVATKWQESQYGLTQKMTVKVTTPDGVWLVWVSVPKALAGRELKGCTVKLSATLTRSDRDESFAFGKRPTEASLLAEKEGK